jgi:ABC-2 type transport system permease protein
MTSTSDTMRGASRVTAASPAAGVRPFFWSVRRELWENRSILVAPAIVGAVVVAAVVLAALSRGSITVYRSGPGVVPSAVAAHERAAFLAPLFLVPAGAVALGGALTGIFYCLGALNGERRDRSILFWKSLPVSDVTTVASKAFLPMVVLPVSVFAAGVVTQLAVLAITAASRASHGASLDVLADLPLPRLWLLLAWGLIASSLWWAPIYGWALLASTWAKRMTLLWAVLPPLGLIVFERVAFDSWHVAQIIRDRLRGSLFVAFNGPLEVRPQGPHDIILPNPDLVGFFTNSGLWIGLAFAALCFAGAVWLRRRAEPV